MFGRKKCDKSRSARLWGIFYINDLFPSSFPLAVSRTVLSLFKCNHHQYIFYLKTHRTPQWSIMQYLNFDFFLFLISLFLCEKKLFFVIYERLILNCLAWRCFAI